MGVKLAPPLSRSPAPHACSGCERDTLHGGQIVFDTLSLSRSFLDRSVDLSSGWLCETSHARTMTACFRVASVGVRKGRGMTKLEDVGKTSFIQQEIYTHVYKFRQIKTLSVNFKINIRGRN